MSGSSKFEGFKDKAAGKYEELKGKAEQYKGDAKKKAAERKEKSDQEPERDSGDGPVDKAADYINKKTGGKYEDKIQTAADKVKDVTGKGDKGDKSS